ncbi:MAG: hypothetical protein WBI79_00680, partial [Kiritimatiellia bacterium]
MKALIQTGSSMSACGHAQAGGRVPVPLKSDFLSMARRVMSFAPPLEGLPRVAGTHAAGLVIGERSLIELIPLTRNTEGSIVTQWDSDSLESMGLPKMDIIGLKTLTVVRDTCDIVK